MEGLKIEWSQTEKDKYHMISLTCGIWKKKVQVNLFTELKDSQIKKTKLWLTGENGEGINCEIGIDIDTLLYVK